MYLVVFLVLLKVFFIFTILCFPTGLFSCFFLLFLGFLSKSKFLDGLSRYLSCFLFFFLVASVMFLMVETPWLLVF